MTFAVAGISGGRTSAAMAFGLPHDVALTFQNTGREHEKTLEFLCRLEDDLKRPIVRLEWRPPPRRGDPPRMASFAEVPHRELARRGEPFRELLETLRAYRQLDGKPAVAPWAKMRLCTAHLKIKTKHRYVLSRGHDTYVDYVGLRYDEPERVRRHRRAARRAVDVRFPLFDAKITKSGVLSFWSRKAYDLDLPEHLGNCTGCFMKDERDLATALLEPTTDAAWWSAIERDFAPMRRGRAGYEQVYAEAPARMAIRAALARGAEPQSDLPPERHRLIVLQERAPKAEPWSCTCDGAEELAAEDDED